MEASIVDIRYKTKEILKALENNETVNITYHGKIKGIISPVIKNKNKIDEHPLFGSLKEENGSVEDELNSLRSGRYDF